jgi:hypothetical protein
LGACGYSESPVGARYELLIVDSLANLFVAGQRCEKVSRIRQMWPPAKLRKRSERATRRLMKRLFFWIEEAAELGAAVTLLHRILIAALIGVSVLCRIITLPRWVLGISLVAVSLILAQHIMIDVCVLSAVEKQCTGMSASVVGPFLEMFSLPNTPDACMGLTKLIEGVLWLNLFLELLRVG